LVLISLAGLPVLAQEWVEQPKDAYSAFSSTPAPVPADVSGDDDAKSDDDDTNLNVAGTHGLSIPKSATLNVASANLLSSGITNRLQTIVDESGKHVLIYISNELPLMQVIFDVSIDTGGGNYYDMRLVDNKMELNGGLVAMAGLNTVVERSPFGLKIQIAGTRGSSSPLFFDLDVVQESFIPAGVTRLLGSLALAESVHDSCNEGCQTHGRVCVQATVAKDRSVKQKYVPFYDLSGRHSEKTNVCTPLTVSKLSVKEPSVFSTCKQSCVAPFIDPKKSVVLGSATVILF